jgi:hypothetical protein
MQDFVKYRFDQTMVTFVKSLSLKSAMFGYDKTDVYAKFKDLLIRAREVCQELVEEQSEQYEQFKQDVLDNIDDPEALAFVLRAHDVSDGVATEDLFAVDAADDEAVYDDLEPEPIDEVDMPEDPASAHERIAALEAENKALRDALDGYAEREELLKRAEDIVEEARREGDEIFREARVRAEQELFLYRAKRRDEEEAFEAELADLETQRRNLEAMCDRHQTYIERGRALFDQLDAYAADRPDAATDDAVDVDDFTPNDDF